MGSLISQHKLGTMFHFWWRVPMCLCLGLNINTQVYKALLPTYPHPHLPFASIIYQEADQGRVRRRQVPCLSQQIAAAPSAPVHMDMESSCFSDRIFFQNHIDPSHTDSAH